MRDNPDPQVTEPFATILPNSATPAVPDTAVEAFATRYTPTDSSPYDTVAAPRSSTAHATLVPGYEIVRELGRGGMGVVYLARQHRPSRMVALKMVLAGAHASAQDLTRFRREIEALAAVSHPNLVPIYEVGEHQGRPFYAMEHVAGGTLAASIAGKPQPPRDSARIVESLARALHSVHGRGIVHRDLKPANILLDGTVPKIADFGLAKTLDDDTSPTLSGSILGTPSYMAPEQAEGSSRKIGPCSDVYALGAILYHMLTGRPPFQAETAWDTIAQVKTEEPVPPRRLRPKLPVDLETICLKCLHKEPARRYGSAAQLADDLARFLAGEPVWARPIGTCERIVKWARRRPAVAALVAVSCLTVVALGIGLTVHAAELRTALAQSEANAEEGRRRLVRLQVAHATRLVEAGDDLAALPWLAVALTLSEGHPDEQLAHRIRLAVTLQQCPHLLRLWHTTSRPRFAAFNADGTEVVCTAEDGTTMRWSVASGESLADVTKTVPSVNGATHWQHAPAGQVIAVSRDGTLALTLVNDRTAQVWDMQSRQVVTPHLVHDRPVLNAVFSPDGKHVATAGADGVARLWSVPAGQPFTTTFKQLGKMHALAFSHDGRLLATAGDDNDAHLWNIETGEALTAPLQHNGSVHNVAFQPRGQLLLTVAYDHTIRLWDFRSRQATDTTPGPAPTPRLTTPNRWLSADGRRAIVADGENGVRLCETGTGAPLGPTLRHGSAILHAAFSPDGTRLVTSSDDNTACIWDPVCGELLTPPLEHAATVHFAAFSPDGRWLATCTDCTTRAWDARTGEPLTSRLPHPASPHSATFNATGQRLRVIGNDGSIQEFDLTPDTRPTADLCDLAHLLAGKRVDGARGLLPLTPRQLHTTWQSLHTRYPAAFALSQ